MIWPGCLVNRGGGNGAGGSGLDPIKLFSVSIYSNLIILIGRKWSLEAANQIASVPA